jgi:hypothetical protein
MPDVSLGAAPPAAVVRLHSPPAARHGGSTSRRVRVLPPCPHCDQPDVSLLRSVLIEEILRAEEPLLELLAEPLRVWSVPTGRRRRGARGRTGAAAAGHPAGAPAHAGAEDA